MISIFSTLEGIDCVASLKTISMTTSFNSHINDIIHDDIVTHNYWNIIKLITDPVRHSIRFELINDQDT